MSIADSLEKLKDIDINDINEIDPARRGSWPLFGRILAFIAAFGGLLAASYFMNIQALDEQLIGEIGKEEVLKKEFRFKASKASSLDAYEQQMEEMNRTFEGLLRQLPRDTNVPGLIDDITEIARQSGIVVKKTEILPERNAEFYVELPFKVVVVGGYHEFGAFVSGIAALPRIVTLHDYSIKASGNKLEMEIQAKTYMYNDSEGKK